MSSCAKYIQRERVIKTNQWSLGTISSYLEVKHPPQNPEFS